MRSVGRHTAGLDSVLSLSLIAPFADSSNFGRGRSADAHDPVEDKAEAAGLSDSLTPACPVRRRACIPACPPSFLSLPSLRIGLYAALQLLLAPSVCRVFESGSSGTTTAPESLCPSFKVPALSNPGTTKPPLPSPFFRVSLVVT